VPECRRCTVAGVFKPHRASVGPTGVQKTRASSTASPPSGVKLGKVLGLRLRERGPVSPYNYELFVVYARQVSDRVLAERVLRGLQPGVGFRTGCELKGDFLEDHSVQLPARDTKKILERTLQRVEQGYVLGPFKRPPFPNEWCSRQAIITLLFCIDKDKWVKNGKVRIISHKSFPPDDSINHHTPRRDSGHEYYTFRKFLCKVARGGKGSLVAAADVIDAYKTTVFSSEDWWQQCHEVAGMFFVDCCGIFGSVTAADTWNCLITLVMLMVAEVLQIPGVDAYVDNIDLVVPPKSTGVPDYKRARGLANVLWKFMEQLGFPLHEIEAPTTKVPKHLGWAVNTMEMTVSLPEGRLVRLRALLKAWSGRKSCTIKELRKVCGYFQYVSSVLVFLKAIVGSVIQLRTRWEASSRRGMHTLPLDFRAALEWFQFLLAAWDGSYPIYDSLRTDYDCTVFADAGYSNSDGGACWGAGAFSEDRKVFYSFEWTAEEVSVGHPSGSPYFELFNYVTAAVTMAVRGAQSVFMVVDCEPAAAAFNKRYSSSADMLELLRFLDCAMLVLPFVVTIDVKPREVVHVADSLARNCVQGVPELRDCSRITPVRAFPVNLSSEPKSCLQAVAKAMGITLRA